MQNKLHNSYTLFHRKYRYLQVRKIEELEKKKDEEISHIVYVYRFPVFGL
jgi:hypothetical protein